METAKAMMEKDEENKKNSVWHAKKHFQKSRLLVHDNSSGYTFSNICWSSSSNNSNSWLLQRFLC